MRYVFKNRGLGKTSDLIRLCLAHDGILIVPTEMSKKYIVDCLCPRINVNPEELTILTVQQVLDKQLTFKEDVPVYIDDFQYLIEKLLHTNNITISGTLTESL